jgi:histidyl-tRNA synthetase
LGAQNAVAAGGRYDGLVAEMGGQAVPAIGFAMGMERLALLLEKQNQDKAKRKGHYLVVDGADAYLKGLILAEQWRDKNLHLQMDLLGGSLKTQLRRADRAAASHVLILGDRELADCKVLIKNMKEGWQELVLWDDVPDMLTPTGQRAKRFVS